MGSFGQVSLNAEGEPLLGDLPEGLLPERLHLRPRALERALGVSFGA